jgi:hypothetical protein
MKRSPIVRRAELFQDDCTDKGKPAVRQGRKAVESGTELTR